MYIFAKKLFKKGIKWWNRKNEKILIQNIIQFKWKDQKVNEKRMTTMAMSPSRTQENLNKILWSVKKGPASFTPSVLQYGPETCQHQSSVLNNSTQKAYTSTLHWMKLHNAAGHGTHCHTPPWGTDNTTAVPSRISTALFSNQVVVWGSSAGKESYIPEEGRESERGGGQLGLRRRFPAGPQWHPRALL